MRHTAVDVIDQLRFHLLGHGRSWMKDPPRSEKSYGRERTEPRGRLLQLAEPAPIQLNGGNGPVRCAKDGVWSHGG